MTTNKNTTSTPKVRCATCRKNRPADEVTTTSRRRSGSYNRGGSSCDTTVCKACCEEAIYWTRFYRFQNNKVWGYYLDGEITYSTACDFFGLEWKSDLPKNPFDEADRFTMVFNADKTVTQVAK
jgi:hypothetical protein